MGVGYLGLFDVVRHTASSEWDDRGMPITTEQVHHTAYPNDEGAYQLMLPGGRTVSANGLLLRDATLVEVVPGQYRAYTSASSADRYSLTVETVNQSGAPAWGISEAQRRRLAKLNRDMRAAGLGITVGKRGVGGIMGHNETPGSYATACPGPDMNLDHVAALALQPEAPPIDHALLRRQKETTMYVRGASSPDIYNVYTDANGAMRIRHCAPSEAAFAASGGLVIFGDDATLTALGVAGQYGAPVVPDVDANVDLVLTETQIAAIAAQISEQIDAGATKAEVEAIVKANVPRAFVAQ